MKKIWCATNGIPSHDPMSDEDDDTHELIKWHKKMKSNREKNLNSRTVTTRGLK